MRARSGLTRRHRGGVDMLVGSWRYFKLASTSWYMCAYMFSDCTTPTPSASHSVLNQFAGSSHAATGIVTSALVTGSIFLPVHGLPSGESAPSRMTRPDVINASFSAL